MFPISQSVIQPIQKGERSLLFGIIVCTTGNKGVGEEEEVKTKKKKKKTANHGQGKGYRIISKQLGFPVAIPLKVKRAVTKPKNI